MSLTVHAYNCIALHKISFPLDSFQTNNERYCLHFSSADTAGEAVALPFEMLWFIAGIFPG